MLDASEPFEAIEEMIDEAPLPTDDRAALWLVAWSLTERDRRVAHPRELELVVSG